MSFRLILRHDAVHVNTPGDNDKRIACGAVMTSQHFFVLCSFYMSECEELRWSSVLHR